jgi:transposase-like protein
MIMDLYKIYCNKCQTEYLAIADGEEISAGIATKKCPKCDYNNLITNNTQFVAKLKKQAIRANQSRSENNC